MLKLKKNVAVVISVCVLLLIISCSILVLNFYPSTKPVEGFNQTPICSVNSESKRIAITFDCVNFGEETVQVLNVLDELEVKGTFFVPGEKIVENRNLLLSLNQTGHDIGNMTFSYDSLGNANVNKIKGEIQECNTVIKEVTGEDCILFRAPYDDYGSKTVKTAGNMGMYSIRHDIDALTWKPEFSTQKAINRIIENVKPGSIIVFNADGMFTEEVLRETLMRLTARGYEFVPVSELIQTEDFVIDVSGTQISA